MKYFTLLVLLSTSIFCFSQANPDAAYTLDPTTSKIIGGFFAIDGSSTWVENGNSTNRHNINIGPYFSIGRSTKRDILLRTNVSWQSTGDSNSSSSIFSLGGGVDWRNEVYQFNRFKVFGSYGPRLGLNVSDNSFDDATLGFEIAATGSVALAYEFTQNLRLLTNVFSGLVQYRRFGEDANLFNYSLRNSLLTPNFSIEYILPGKS